MLIFDQLKKSEPQLRALSLLILLGLLLLQPDVGMTLVVASVWVTQMFLAGIPMVVVAVMMSPALPANAVDAGVGVPDVTLTSTEPT